MEDSLGCRSCLCATANKVEFLKKFKGRKYDGGRDDVSGDCFAGVSEPNQGMSVSDNDLFAPGLNPAFFPGTERTTDCV